MDATLILIDSDAELARARALVDRLWQSEDPADIARLQAQARLIAGYEESKWPRRPVQMADLIRHLQRAGTDPPGWEPKHPIPGDPYLDLPAHVRCPVPHVHVVCAVDLDSQVQDPEHRLGQTDDRGIHDFHSVTVPAFLEIFLAGMQPNRVLLRLKGDCAEPLPGPR